MFRFGHATHPNWQGALELALAQIEGQLQLEQFAPDRSRQQKIGLVYFTEPFAEHAQSILNFLIRKTGYADWVGASASGVCATGAEYFQEPAIVLMLMEFPADSVRIFSGRLPLPKSGTLNKAGRDAVVSGLVHIDPTVDDITDLIQDLSTKFTSDNIVGGLISNNAPAVQIAREVVQGGVSGLLFAENVELDVRLTQGCQPVGPEHVVTRSHGQFAIELDNEPALDVLMRDLGLDDNSLVNQSLDDAAALISGRVSNGLFVGLRSEDASKAEHYLRFAGAGAGLGAKHQEYRVRPVVGLEPNRRSLAIADRAQPGERLVFCVRDETAARSDLVRICAELRDELDAPAPKLSEYQAAGFQGMKSVRQPMGAIYVACNGRGASMFGHSGAELQIIREQLGDIPLIGFFASGEIRGDTLYGYTGILTLIY